MESQTCTQCKKSFLDYKSNHRKFCSMNCKNNSQLIDKSLICLECGDSFEFVRSNRSYNRSKFCGKECRLKSMSRLKTGQIAWNKGIRHLSISGDNHWNWKGGNKRGKRGAEQRRFRLAVLKRDNYKCTECGADDTKLVADHIKPYAYYPELREDISNGRTLCVDCNYESTYIRKDWAINHG